MFAPDYSALDRLNNVLDANLADADLSIERVCRELGISRSHLHRLLKEHTEQSITLYIRQRRLQRARSLLQNKSLRIAEVAEQVGIPNPQNFSKYFTEAFGTSPTEFRRQPTHTESVVTLSTYTQPPVDSSPGIGPVATPLPLPAAPTGVIPTRPYRRLWPLLMALAGIGLAVAGWFRQTEPELNQPPAQGFTNSIAILPFRNMGGPDTAPICEGITDNVHTAISLMEHVKVIARSSSNQYQRSDKTVWQIGSELHSDNLLKGSVLKVNNQLRVRLELIRTRDDISIWTKNYQDSYQNIFPLISQMVNDVAQQLHQPMTATTIERLGRMPTRDTAAYNAFLLGRQLMISRDREKLRLSLHQFDQAIAADSNFAEARAYKAAVYNIQRNMGYNLADSVLRLAEQNALRAIQLDSRNSTAYAALAMVYRERFRPQEAETTMQIALQHNPNDAQANYWYSLILRSAGRLDEALPYSAKAVALDPLYPLFLIGHIVSCGYAGRYEMARPYLATGKLLFNDSFLFHAGMGYFCLAQGNLREAQLAFGRAQSLNPDMTNLRPLRAYCAARLGQLQEAIDFLQLPPPTTGRDYYERAIVYAGLGQRSQCLTYLKAAADRGYCYVDLGILPVFAPYRQEPVFRAVLHQFGQPLLPRAGADEAKNAL